MGSHSVTYYSLIGELEMHCMRKPNFFVLSHIYYICVNPIFSVSEYRGDLPKDPALGKPIQCCNCNFERQRSKPYVSSKILRSREEKSAMNFFFIAVSCLFDRVILYDRLGSEF